MGISDPDAGWPAADALTDAPGGRSGSGGSGGGGAVDGGTGSNGTLGSPAGTGAVDGGTGLNRTPDRPAAPPGGGGATAGTEFRAADSHTPARDAGHGTAAGHPPRRSAAVVIVPTLLGLLGFVAVASAVTAEASTVDVTAPGLMLAFTALIVAGGGPLYARRTTWRSLRRPAVLLAACLAVEAVLFLAAPQLVLFSLPALPLALGGGVVLLATSLWGQFRKGPVPDPVIITRSELPPRPFTSTLAVVGVNWLLFLAAGAVCAWLLLGD